jgi:hypothetical protein
MILIVYGPRLRPEQYRALQRELLKKLSERTVEVRGFHERDIRIFFPLMAAEPDTVEVAIFAGGGAATTLRETTAWKKEIEEVVARHFPTYVINGFVAKLDAAAQFTSIAPLAK